MYTLLICPALEQARTATKGKVAAKKAGDCDPGDSLSSRTKREHVAICRFHM